MKELEIPFDESHKLVLFSLLSREGVKFHEAPFYADPYRWAQRPSRFILVLDEDYDRAV